MKTNNTNPLLKEEVTYQERYENKNVKFARVRFVDQEEKTVFVNMNYLSRKKRPLWKRVNDENALAGIVDANPTSKMAEFSGWEISKDGEDWAKVSDLAVV